MGRKLTGDVVVDEQEDERLSPEFGMALLSGTAWIYMFHIVSPPTRAKYPN